MSGGRDARTRWASRPESRLTGLRSVPTESPQNPHSQLTWFGRRHVFVLVRMTYHATVLARMRPCSPTRAPSSPARWVLKLATGQACLLRKLEPGARGAERSGPMQRVPGRGLDLRLRDSPISPRPSASRFDAHSAPFVLVEMITPRTCSPAVLRTPAAGTPPPSPDTTPRCLGKPEHAGRGAAGIGQGRTSIARPNARCKDPQTGARCDPGAGPLAGSAAGPMARSSSGGSSPVVRPARGPRGVAG
jgi:hypothetical protein